MPLAPTTGGLTGSGAIWGCAAMAALFDTFERTDASPSEDEDSFAFLNRAAGPYWARVRTLADAWFAAFPADQAADLRQRFRGRDWSEHIGAWWELYPEGVIGASTSAPGGSCISTHCSERSDTLSTSIPYLSVYQPGQTSESTPRVDLFCSRRATCRPG
jgi:hypothetical protein